MEEREEEKAKGSERWRAATGNLLEMAANLDSLQKLLVKKAVYVDQETFAKASLSSEQTRTIKVRISGPIELNELCLLTTFGGCIRIELGTVEAFEQRVETLERELDSAISAAAHARSEKRQAEAAQKAAELHAQEVTKELENTTKLCAKQEEISKRDNEIKLLEAIIQTLGEKE